MKTQLKILQVFSRYLQYGGEEGSVKRIGDSLRQRYRVDSFLKSSEELLGGSFLDKASLPFRAFHNTKVIRHLRESQRLESYDFWLIHNVFPAISPSAYTLAHKIGVPIVHYLHNYRFGCANSYLFTKGEECRKCLHGNFIHGALGKCWRGSFPQSTAMALLLTRARYQQKVFETISHFIAISDAQKRIHVEMGIPEDKISVVHHYLETPHENESIPFPEDGHALCIGRLSPEKGVDRLIKAWALLPAHRKLVIAGSGPAEKELHALAASLGLKNVEFTGFLDKEAQKAVWEKTLFSVVPSVWQEPFGMVVLEAWAKGRPVVAHDIGALPEIITHGRDGFLAGTEKPQQLADALQLAFDSIDALPAMGHAGFERMTEYYNETRWLEDISAVFEKLDSLNREASQC